MTATETLDLKDLILRYNLSDERTLKGILEKCRLSGRSFREELVESGVVSEDALLFAIGMEMDIPFVTLTPESIDRNIILGIPRELLEEKMFVPLIELEDEIRVAVADPGDRELMKFLQETYPGRKISLSVSVPSNIAETINAVFAENEEDREAMKTPAISLYYTTLLDAVRSGASAIYIEARGEKMRLRLRKGVKIIRKGEFPSDFLDPIMERVSGSITPDQTGRGSITTEIGGRRVFLSARLIGRPGSRGAVILIRYPGRLPSLRKLPIDEEYLNLLIAELHNTSGLIAVTGTDEDFVTDTVIALLRELNPARRKITGILRDDLPLEDLERYIHLSTGEVDRSIANLTGTCPDSVFIQDMGRDGLNIRQILNLSRETLVITTFQGKAPSLLNHLREQIGGLPDGLLMVETNTIPVLCPYCSMMNWSRGAGCRRCGYSGISRYIRKIEIKRYTEGGTE